jgi:uncharacterized membrane protein YbhN (UPF0104 family)
VALASSGLDVSPPEPANQASDPETTPDERVPVRPPSVLRRLARAAFVTAALTLLLVAVFRDRRGFEDALSSLDLASLTVASGAVIGGAVLNMLAWRASMAAVGVAVPLVSAARVFYVSQLGKYIPGSVWPVVAQLELTRDTGVSRLRGVVGVLLAMVVALVTSTVIACCLLVLPVAAVRAEYWWLLTVLPLAAAALHPAVLRVLLATALRLTRRTARVPALHGRQILSSVLWSTAMWAILGLHAWLLASQVSAGGITLPAAIGAFALAWAAGFVAVVVPAGLGVREAALVLVFSSAMSPANALAVALVSRVLMTVADAVAAGVAAGVHAWRKPNWQHTEPHESTDDSG